MQIINHFSNGFFKCRFKILNPLMSVYEEYLELVEPAPHDMVWQQPKRKLTVSYLGPKLMNIG